MKHLLFFALISGFVVANAQVVEFDPVEQYYFRHLVPTLVQYDSITAASDTNTNFSNSVIATATIESVPQDSSLIDTMVVKSSNGSVITLYSGNSNTDRHLLACFNPSMTPDTVRSYTYYKDHLGQDSLLIYKTRNNGSLEVFSKLQIEFNSNGNVSKITEEGSLPPFSGNFDTISQMRFYYATGNKLDSVIKSGASGSLRLYYNYSNNALQGITGYLKNATTGSLTKTISYSFKNNSAGQVYETHSFAHVPSTSFNKALRYSVKKKSIGLINHQPMEGISVYPNPATDFLKLETSDLSVTYEIRDMQGRLVMSGAPPTDRINVSNLRPAQYIITIHTEGGSISEVFTRQ